jgi:hypothetical protein
MIFGNVCFLNSVFECLNLLDISLLRWSFFLFSFFVFVFNLSVDISA